MEARTLRVLEFDKVRQMVAERAATSLGEAMCGEIAPNTDAEQVRVWQQETTEARRLLDAGLIAPFGGIHDVSESVRRARAGGALEARALLDVADTATGARRLRAFLLENASAGGEFAFERADGRRRDRVGGEGTVAEGVRLTEWARRLRTFEPLERAVRRCVGEDGEILDRASPLLAKTRAEARRLQRGVRERLDSLVHSGTGRRALQEQWVTIRNGRYVVPVKQESRGDVPGIVHDRSATGATLFVEPMPVVELNNRIREVEAEAEREEARVLKELSAHVAGQHEALLATLGALAALDLIFAKARLSVDMEGAAPHLNVDGRLHVRRGRHPLLGKDAVPIDVWLGEAHRTLVITGPNTGGKTVTLKTVGLLTLMAQAGLHVPADEGTELAVFSQIFADIGDEQSIEQNLSTFSSHMKAIARVLDRVRGGALVLLDELGAGTDPQEGAALARAILEWLTEREVLVVATTHYSELKSFAFTSPSVQNASVEFDAVTLKPTYRLRIGVPGRSNAFKIGERLGLPDGVLRRAEEAMTRGARQTDELIEGLQRDKLRAAAERAEQERLRGELEQSLQSAEALRRKLQRDVSEVVAETRREADGLLRQARRDVERVTAEVRRLETNSERVALSDVERLRRDVHGAGERLSVWAERAADVGAGARSRREADMLEADALSKGDGVDVSGVDGAGGGDRRIAAGDRVFVDRLGRQGDVIDLSEESAVVRVGALRVQVRVDELRPVRRGRAETPFGEKRPTAEPGGGTHALARHKAQRVAAEIDLRGLTVEEGRQAVDKYLDDAELGGLDRVRIIHGKGTGALRNGIRELLTSHPAVFEATPGGSEEGGDGVTVVRLSPPTG